MSLSPLPQIDRPDSRVSLALSDTTYHSFHDVELYEPEVSPNHNSAKQHSWTSHKNRGYEVPVVQEIRRQDSGYESMARRDSHSSHRRTSSASATSSTRQRRTKATTQRCSKTGPVSQVPRRCRQSTSPRTSYSPRQPQQPPVTYFQFPHFITAEPEVVDETEMTVTRNYATGPESTPTQEAPAHPLPPQTTHYWTSDKTRRLEYAAIDAASRGVRGWIRRHVVPECFVPKEKRRLGFEDDRGSVVRYRLELEGEEETEKDGGRRQRRKNWWFILRRH
ncbi:hypothetical protein V8F06_002809 [Rhypophila decipiens]